MIRPGVLAGADLIASRRELANIELTLAGLPSRELVLRRCLRDMRARYDYILLDCPRPRPADHQRALRRRRSSRST